MRAAWLVVGVVACGDGKGSADAPIDFHGDPLLVTASVSSAPAYIRYRDGQNGWATPQQLAGNDYQFPVTGEYALVVVCTNALGDDLEVFYRTPADGDAFDVLCIGGTPPMITTHQVTGSMTQPGIIFFYNVASSATGPWSFDLRVREGTNDLVAIGTNSRIAIQRDRMITAPTTIVAPIDVDQMGQPLVPVAYTLNGAGTNSVVARTDWITPHGRAQIAATPTTLATVPSSLVMPTDEQRVFIVATAPGAASRRGLSRTLSASTTYDLLPVLTGVTYTKNGNDLEASWSTLPPFTEVWMTLLDGNGMMNVSATRAWLEGTGKYVSFADRPSDFQASWLVDATSGYDRDFTLFDFTATERRFSVVSETAVARIAHRMPPHVTELEQRAALRAWLEGRHAEALGVGPRRRVWRR